VSLQEGVLGTVVFLLARWYSDRNNVRLVLGRGAVANFGYGDIDNVMLVQ